MPAPTGVITLITDFGHNDILVGVMKGVIAGVCPAARVVDLCHYVTPFDAAEAASLLCDAYPYFPQGTIHVVVVDPGVGASRDIILVHACGHYFIAPDTGALWPVASGRSFQAVKVTNSQYFLPTVSATFHGRDIFAPVAAHLCLGVPLASFGPPISEPRRLDAPTPSVFPSGAVVGAVVRCDRFGNLITNIPRSLVANPARAVVSVGGHVLRGIHATFSDAPPGEALAYFGSFGAVEIAVNRGDASQALKAGRGDAVEITLETAGL
ncbi:MAG TPA: SAM-dependent chlorinase/fluorinase [Candidatus Brocadiia bacterium]|nr:SAM-dependent chlorinase/fluorinase [Candidatus Brocadiia bacterium]